MSDLPNTSLDFLSWAVVVLAVGLVAYLGWRVYKHSRRRRWYHRHREHRHRE